MSAIIDHEFAGYGGTTLRGRLHLPVADGPVPAVAMAHGFSAVMEMGLPPFAKALCRQGIAVLLYDHRNLGISDGEPRQEINPWAQMRDYRCALDELASHPAVDAERLGLWGSSFSGGEVLVLGAVDDRVKAIVANVPFAGTSLDPENTRDTYDAIRAELDGPGGLAEPGGAVFGPMTVVNEGDAEGALLGQPESSEWFLDVGPPTGTWRNEVTLANAFGSEPPFDPGVCVEYREGKPLLMVVATDDRVAPAEVALATFARAAEPKELVMIEGHHFTPYSGEGAELAIAATCRFLGDNL